MKRRGLFFLIPAWTGLLICCFYYYMTLPKLPLSVIVHNKRCADGSLDCYEAFDQDMPADSRSRSEVHQSESEISPTVLGTTYQQHEVMHEQQLYSRQDNQYGNRAEAFPFSHGKTSTSKLDDQIRKLRQYSKEGKLHMRHGTHGPREESTAKLDIQHRKLQQHSETDVRSGKVSIALSLHFMDQITCAARRVRSLQCWASQSERVIQVVEPTINGSYLSPPLKKPIDGIVPFRNMFDIDWWNTRGSKEAEYLPLVASEDFFRHAPRSTILVKFIYQDDPRCFENPPPNSTCAHNEVMRFWLETLKELSFTILKQVCIDFRKIHHLTKNVFDHLIFGSVSADTPVTIIFNDWRGPLSEPNKNEFRALLRYRDSKCSPMSQDSFVRKLTTRSLKPTPDFFHSAEAYAMKYLHTGSKYVAVMVRWELILLEHVYRYHAFKGEPNSGETCKEQIRSIVKDLYTERGIRATFLATDAGRYGSRVLQPNASFHGKSYWKPANKLTEELLEALNNKTMTMEQYDSHFAEFSRTRGFSSTYYVPQLQKAIAVRAECLLLVGWGTFHDNVLALYTELHGHGTQLCYKHIQSC